MIRKAMKILISAVNLALVITFLTFGSVGCSRDLKVFENGYFQYVIVDENNRNTDKDNGAVIAIVGFTLSGKQQEIIEFPREIDGIPVQYIGYRDYSTFQESFYHLESTKLKKAYVHDNIKSVYREAFLCFDENEQDLEIMICAPRSPYSIFEEHNYGKFYIYKSLFDSDSFNENVYWANIVFMNNYSFGEKEGYYSLDNIETGGKIPVPSTAPERNGYEFTGWYTEPECINKWDFDMTLELEKDEEFRLYAGWQTL